MLLFCCRFVVAVVAQARFFFCVSVVSGARFCFCCRPWGRLFFFGCRCGGRVSFFAVVAGGFFLAVVAGTGVHSLTGFLGPRNDNQKKQHNATTPKTHGFQP